MSGADLMSADIDAFLTSIWPDEFERAREISNPIYLPIEEQDEDNMSIMSDVSDMTIVECPNIEELDNEGK